MPAFQDITGVKFNKLTAKNITGKKINGSLLWNFSCECGGKIIAKAGSVKFGNTRSCGCLRKTEIVKRFTKHGHAPQRGCSRTYNSWYAMLQRCSNPNNKCYKNYGGAGVTVCKRWVSFSTFLKDMGERPEGTVLGRRGDVGNYKPNNCTWQTHEEDTETRRDKRR